MIVMADSQLLNHTVPGQALYLYEVPILSPVTDNLLFLNQLKREIFSTKECTGREGLSQDRCLRSGHTTELPRPVRCD